MSSRIKIAVVLALIAVLAIAVVGCSQSASAPSTGSESAAPSGGESAGDGQALVEQKCTMCHPINQVNEAKYDAAGWEALISRMEQNGLVVTAEERQAILDYLVERDAGN